MKDSDLGSFLFSLDVQKMHADLFDRCPPRVAVSDAAVMGMLRGFRESAELEAFRVWLVGSRLEPNRALSDVDMVLSPRTERPPEDSIIEHALWFCRSHGLQSPNPCLVDACYRRSGPTVGTVALEPDAIVTSFKLLSPGLMRAILDGEIQDYRLAGRFSIEYRRLARDIIYFERLPWRLQRGYLRRYLRPALEIT